MSRFDEKLEMIEKNKRKLSYSVAKAYADILENEEMINMYFPVFYKKAKETRVFINVVNEVKLGFQEQLESLKKELDAFVKEQLHLYNEREASEYIDNNANLLNQLEDKPLSDKVKDVIEYSIRKLDKKGNNHRNYKRNKYERLYNKNISEYMSVGIPSDSFVKISMIGGKENIDKLQELTNKIVKLEKDELLKKDFFILKEFMKNSLSIEKFVEFYGKYKLNNISDLMDLLNEISAFIVDDKDIYNEDIKDVIEKNRDSFRSRIGVPKQFKLDTKEALDLKKDIEEIYTNHLFEETFIKSNFGDFFEKYKLDYTLENLKFVVSLNYYFYGSYAQCFEHDFGDGLKTYCFLSEDIFDKDKYLMWDSIIHEFVHSFSDIFIDDNSEMFCEKYPALDEVLTDYVAKFGFLNFMGLDIKDFDFDKYGIRSQYNFALPIIAVLRESIFWKDIINAKIRNSVNGLEKKISEKDLFSICDSINHILECNNSQILEDVLYNEIEKVSCIIENAEKAYNAKKTINNSKKTKR